MKTPFRLDEHPRRAQPLAAPPDGYFEQLPRRVMQRVQPAPTDAPLLGWLAALPRPLRTALAASAVLTGFAGAFWLSDSSSLPAAPTTASTQALATVPRAELVNYLLTSEQPATLYDLAELPATAHALPETFLRPSARELQDILDAQPTEETYL